MEKPEIIRVDQLSHVYKKREAISDLSFHVDHGEIFGLLGPNGSGKSTLLRILATILKAGSGKVKVAGLDLSKEYKIVRRKIGVVFQSPSLDNKLSVRENLVYQGRIYGLRGKCLTHRIDQLLESFSIEDRDKEVVETLSGGLKRRVELAKGLLHKPQILLLDEPSTGLDPGARNEFWNFLKQVNESENVTILAATHLMEEAECCNRLMIMNEGKAVAEGTPSDLKSEIGKDVLVVESDDNAQLQQGVREKLNREAQLVNGHVLIEHERGHQFVTELVEAFPGRIQSVTFRKPTLEDVFLHKTGHQFWEESKKS